MASDYILVMSTVPSEDQGKEIARTLINEKLVPCVNIIPAVKSLYMWKNKLNEDDELILIMKSKASLFDKIKERILELHSYECPEIIALPIINGFESYLNWIDENTSE